MILHQNLRLIKLKGSLIDVVCARVGGANTTPYLNSAVHFAKQKTYNSFLLLQNMNSVGKNERVQNPARIPPQTPPADGNTAEAGRIRIPRKLFRPASSIQVSSSGFSAKKVRISTKRYRHFRKFEFWEDVASALCASAGARSAPDPDFARICHAPRGQKERTWFWIWKFVCAKRKAKEILLTNLFWFRQRRNAEAIILIF